MDDYKRIADHLKIYLGVNVFEKTRKMENVDARSLFCHILNKDMNLTLYKIRDIFLSNGLSFDHSTVHYNVKLFAEVRKRRPIFEDIRFEILGKLEPKFLLLKRIDNEMDYEVLKQIENCINEFTNGN